MFNSKKKAYLPIIDSQKKKLLQSESRFSQRKQNSLHLNFSQNQSINQQISLSRISHRRTREIPFLADQSKKTQDSSLFTSKLPRSSEKIRLLRNIFSSSDNNHVLKKSGGFRASRHKKKSIEFFENNLKSQKLELLSKRMQREGIVLGTLDSKKKPFIIKNPNSNRIKCFRQLKSKNKENAPKKKYSIRRKSISNNQKLLNQLVPEVRVSPDSTFEIEFSLSDFRKISKEKNHKTSNKDFSRYMLENFGSMKKVDEYFSLYFKKVERIGQNYKSLREIGRGSYAVVYLATDIRSLRELVLKSIFLKNFRKPVHVQRFMVIALTGIYSFFFVF